MSRIQCDVVLLPRLEQACMQMSSRCSVCNNKLSHDCEVRALYASHVYHTLRMRSAATFLVSRAMYSKDNDSNASPAKIAMSSP